MQFVRFPSGLILNMDHVLSIEIRETDAGDYYALTFISGREPIVMYASNAHALESWWARHSKSWSQ